MGKEGPCYHCGVTSTPLWRNGPPEKPILCNACGSRWRTRGTLSNYTPLHVRAKAGEYEDPKDSKRKTVYFKERDVKMKKRKLSSDNSVVKRYASEANYNQNFLKMTYEDTSNRSSSGSAVSNLESCAQFSSVDASGSSGPAQSFALELQVPSKKRTCVIHTKSSPVEKLIKDLHAIMHEQESSCLSGFSEEDLLFESNEPMVSVEIGHGSVLIKHPSSMVREEESEASSLSAENKPSAVNDSYSCSASLCWRNYLKSDNVCYHGSGNILNLTGKIMQQETAKRDKFNHDRMQLFWTHDSALCCIDLNDVINFEALLGHLTIDEQQQLLKYLPSADTFQFPGSLRDMFDSDCFKENLLYFQQLLSEGVFSNTDSGVKSEELKTLKKLALSNLAKSKWMELYSKLKDSRSNHRAGGNHVASASKLSSLKDLGSAKTPLHEPIKFTPDKETTIGRSSISSLGNKETLNGDGSYMTPRTLFSLPIDGHCITLESCKFPDESSDHDLLLDIPSNGCFPEAELLLPTSSFVSYQTSASSSSRFLAQI